MIKPQPEMPAGMVEVSEDEFFDLLMHEKRDIMPRNDHPNATTWRDWRGDLWGWSKPGWRNPRDPRVHAVLVSVVEGKK